MSDFEEALKDAQERFPTLLESININLLKLFYKTGHFDGVNEQAQLIKKELGIKIKKGE